MSSQTGNAKTTENSKKTMELPLFDTNRVKPAQPISCDFTEQSHFTRFQT